MAQDLTLVRNSIELYEQIFENNNDPKIRKRLEWMHEHNPAKKKYFSIYQDEVAKTPAALYAVFPVIFKKFDKNVNAVQSIDTITDVNYRGMGLFKKLALDCYKNASEDGVDFVYGFPNDQSAPGFFKSLGWKPITEVKKSIPFHININLGLKWLFKQSKHSFVEKDITHFEDSYNALWKKYANTFNIGVHRDADYMNWRIAHHPTEQYIIKTFSVGDKLAAIFVLSIKEEKHNGKIGYVMDTIFDPEYLSDMPQLFHKAIKNVFYKAKVDIVLAWGFDHSINYKTYKGNGFITLPAKLQPIKLFFGANNFVNADDVPFFDKKNWYLSYCDSDTV
jgi:Acetyltransferase (GNAT) domain